MQTLSRVYQNDAGQNVTYDDYFNLTGATYSSSTSLGTLNTNFYRTTQGYDDRGRPDETISPTGTINRTVYDGLGRQISAWVGTNDMPASGERDASNNTCPANMVKVTDYQYDGGGVGDSNLTQITEYPGGSDPNRVTQAWNDWRDRAGGSEGGVQSTESTSVHRPILYYTYDNLNEVTEVQELTAMAFRLRPLVPRPD